ncbi:hypothetical protein [Shewanella atlantica]|uniref:hypothetical protein n=1 Tax=Shewanella atlantica TaxID=271099 RepID=UPI003736F92A
MRYSTSYIHIVVHKWHSQHLTSMDGGNVLSMSGTYKTMLLATSEKHSYSTFKRVNVASDALKLAFQEFFGLSTFALNDFTREQPFSHPFALN